MHCSRYAEVRDMTHGQELNDLKNKLAKANDDMAAVLQENGSLKEALKLAQAKNADLEAKQVAVRTPRSTAHLFS